MCLQLQQERPLKRTLLLTITLGVAMAAALCSASLAHAQVTTPAAALIATPTQEPTVNKASAVGVPEPDPARSRAAITFNPLNLFISRYGFNFEYHPVPHHALVVSPYFVYFSGAAGTRSDSLAGGGAELGYRLYSGKQRFDGFFVGGSLIVSRYRLTSEEPPNTRSHLDFTGIGGAFDVGWQWQLGHFIIGGSTGVQYTRPQRVPPIGSEEDLLIGANVVGSVLPRFAFNLGYAF